MGVRTHFSEGIFQSRWTLRISSIPERFQLEKHRRYEPSRGCPTRADFKIGRALRVASGITCAAAAGDSYILREVERCRSVNRARARRGNPLSATCVRLASSANLLESFFFDDYNLRFFLPSFHYSYAFLARTIDGVERNGVSRSGVTDESKSEPSVGYGRTKRRREVPRVSACGGSDWRIRSGHSPRRAR